MPAFGWIVALLVGALHGVVEWLPISSEGTVVRVLTLLDYEPEIAVVENPREFETVTEDFTVDTETAKSVIGFEAERTVEAAVREMLRQ